MKAQLNQARHDVLPGQACIEVWFNGKLIGAIYGEDGPGIRFITKHPVAIGDNRINNPTQSNPNMIRLMTKET